MPITYNETTKDIYLDKEASKGTTWAIPFRPDDLLYIPGVEKTGGTAQSVFTMPYKIIIGADTYFEIKDESLIFLSDTLNVGDAFMMGITSHLKIGGTLVGSNIMFQNRTTSTLTGEVILENVTFNKSRGLTFQSGITAKKCTFIQVGSIYIGAATNANEYEDCTFNNCLYGIIPQYNMAVNNRNKFINCGTGMLAGYNTNEDYKAYNMQFINCPTDIAMQPRSLPANNRKITLVDSLVDTSKIVVWGTVANRALKIFLDSTFSFRIKEGDGATIKVLDKDANEVFSGTLDVNGELNQEINYYNRYVLASGVYGQPTADVINVLEPFTVSIEKVGFQTLEIPNISITPGVSKNIVSKLLAPIPLPPSISQVEITSATTPTATDGQITITAISGTAPYEYSLNGVDWQLGNVLSGLAEDEYSIFVRDVNLNEDSIAGIKVDAIIPPVLVDATLTGAILEESLVGTVEDFETITGELTTYTF